MVGRVSAKSELASAIGYALTRWRALTRYRDDGRIEIDNNAAERALRGVSLGRKNCFFMGSDAGGERAATIYRLVETAKLNGLDPEAYLRDVLERIADYPINRIDVQASLTHQQHHGHDDDDSHTRAPPPNGLGVRSCPATSDMGYRRRGASSTFLGLKAL